jgi:hypothetical protein
MNRSVIRILLPIVGVIVGAVTAVATVALIESISSRLYPLPAGVDPRNFDAMREHVKKLPPAAFAFVLAAWWLGTLAGGWVAAAIAGRRPAIWSGIIAALMFAASLYVLAVIPHPTWFAITGLAGIPWFGWLAAKLAPVRRDSDDLLQVEDMKSDSDESQQASPDDR